MTDEKFNGLTVEELRSLFFDQDALRLPPVRLFRIEARGIRIYYTFDKGYAEMFPGITGMLGKVLPTSEELIKWKCQMGYDESFSYMNERADYGSLMHSLFVPLSISGTVNLDEIHDITAGWCELRGIPFNDEWPRELKSDLLAYAQWMIDYQVKPIAIEVPLITRKYQVATMVDMFCKLMYPKKGFWGEKYKSGTQAGQPKETIRDVETYAIVDFKSRKKSYVTETDELQLEFGKQMVVENYPEFDEKLISLFSWHPKEWRSSPGYYFTEHTGKHDTEELELLSRLYQKRVNLNEVIRTETRGVVDIRKKDLSENYEIRTLIDIINSYKTDENDRTNQKEGPDSTPGHRDPQDKASLDR